MVVGSARDIVETCGVPRFLFVDYPLGNPCGRPWAPAEQKGLFAQALRLLERAYGPRTTVQAPERGWPSVNTLFDVVYDLEKGVTASINRLYSLAEQVGERSATAMLDWFVAEQLQEEAEARFVRKRLRLAGDNSAALLLLDQQFLEGTALSYVKGNGAGAGVGAGCGGGAMTA